MEEPAADTKKSHSSDDVYGFSEDEIDDESGGMHGQASSKYTDEGSFLNQFKADSKKAAMAKRMSSEARVFDKAGMSLGTKDKVSPIFVVGAVLGILFLPVFVPFMRELVRRKEEEAYVQKAMKIQEQQKKEYLASKKQEELEALKALEANSTDTNSTIVDEAEDDDDDEDYDDDDEDYDDDDEDYDDDEDGEYEDEDGEYKDEDGVDEVAEDAPANEVREDDADVDGDDDDGKGDDGPAQKEDIDRLNALLGRS